MFWLKLYLLSLLVPFIFHSVAYLFDLFNIDYDSSDAPPMVVITSLVWPIVIVCLVVVGSGVGFIKGMKSLKKKIQKTIADRKEAKRRAAEVVNEEVEIVATTRHR